MPRRDQISETKKQRLQEEQEQLQKLMFDARSSVRRSSLKGDNDTENRLYPPLGTKPNTSDDDEAMDHPESAGVLWPKLNNKQKEVKEQAEEYAAQKGPLTEKDLFPVQEFLNNDIKEIEPLPEILDEQNTKKLPLTETDLFPVQEFLTDRITKPEPLPESLEKRKTEKPLLTETDLFPEPDPVTDSLRQPKEKIIKVISPEQNVVTSIPQHSVRPVEEIRSGKIVMADAPDLQETRFEQIEEEPAIQTIEVPATNRKRSKTFSYAAMFSAALLLGFGGYYFYVQNQANDNTLANKEAKPLSVPASQTSASPQIDSAIVRNENVAKAGPVKPIDTETKKDPVKESPAKPTAKTPVTVKERTTTSAPVSGSSLGQYKVISKAYFHNEPDENTRRKAFIIHWNNAVLTPLEEKKGFVYIVFTNHLGQTSKGWLRKKDLRQLN